MSSSDPLNNGEWLETDGLGGFASGTVSGIRTRRYHAILLAATTPPTGRMVLVNGFDAWLETAEGKYPLTKQHYAPDVIVPDDAAAVTHFTTQPWPTWTLRCPNGIEVQQELFMAHGSPTVFLRWSLISRPTQPTQMCRLKVRPFFSGRDFHSLHHENGAFRFEPESRKEGWIWTPYEGVPAVSVRSNGAYAHEPEWYRHFFYSAENERGLDDTEDLAAPGIFSFDLTQKSSAELCFVAGRDTDMRQDDFNTWSDRERTRRLDFPTAQHRAADSYIVKRGHGSTIIAGYPWFGDWGRDTFIALRGLCLATGRTEIAKSILLEWAGTVSEGMLPNRFPDHGETPEFNSVDASLWYVIAVQDYLQRVQTNLEDRQTLQHAVEQILQGYHKGTRYGIHADHDGLLACGVPGVQLTWMDAKVRDWVVTPRMGKPVEIQALWLNALAFGATFSQHWKAVLDQGVATFALRFWNEQASALYDVVDVDHQAGEVDASVRPNQIFAVGGLPLVLLDHDRGRVVDTVEQQLLTPLGLRSLAPGSANYSPHYEGDVWHRDGSYHQGTVWPWLVGPFIEAWLHVHGETAENRIEARRRFLAPLHGHLQVTGLDHVSEIADAEPPYTPRGCPFQAWSLGELLRMEVRLA